jgi:phytoene dehydrogenase-like protein
MRYDALVIGAGMSGLAAGIRLAQMGKRTALLERHYLWGGLNSFFKREGRRLDTGLHALTNYVPKGTPGAPLTKLLRQLRIPYDALELAPQSWSQTVFRIGGELVRLRYSNDAELLRSEIARVFPSQRDGFERLLAALPTFADQPLEGYRESARRKLAEFVRDPLLVEMLMAGPCYYGCPTERDMTWNDYGVLFRSIHVEGMARPESGVKRVLDVLRERLRAEGGELRTRTGVKRIVVENSAVRGVELDDGQRIECECVLSSAGLVETRELCGQEADPRDVGKLTFVETTTVLDCEPREFGHEATITFFNEGETFDYASSEGLVDLRSGVLTCPNNYATATPLEEGMLRATVMASYDAWKALPAERYASEKARVYDAVQAAIANFGADARPHARWSDAFTPLTIERYTGKRGGAVYGSPRKVRDGASGVRGLHIIGTDQGLVGIVGALLSGILIANRTLMEPQATK